MHRNSWQSSRVTSTSIPLASDSALSLLPSTARPFPFLAARWTRRLGLRLGPFFLPAATPYSFRSYPVPGCLEKCRVPLLKSRQCLSSTKCHHCLLVAFSHDTRVPGFQHLLWLSISRNASNVVQHPDIGGHPTSSSAQTTLRDPGSAKIKAMSCPAATWRRKLPGYSTVPRLSSFRSLPGSLAQKGVDLFSVERQMLQQAKIPGQEMPRQACKWQM